MLLLWTQYCAVGHMCIICHTFLSAQGSKLGPKTSELYSMRFGMSNDPSNGINRCPSLVCPKNYQTILSAVLTPASLMVVKSPSPISNVMQMAFFSCIIPFENDQYWSLLCFFSFYACKMTQTFVMDNRCDPSHFPPFFPRASAALLRRRWFCCAGRNSAIFASPRSICW